MSEDVAVLELGIHDFVSAGNPSPAFRDSAHCYGWHRLTRLFEVLDRKMLKVEALPE